MKHLLIVLAFVCTLFGEQIDKYIVNVNILPNGALQISEDINYNFGNLRRHGIFRDIPTTIKYNNKVYDLGFSNFAVLQDNKSANYEKSSFYSSKTGKNIKLKIGSKNYLITSLHNYKISYTINKIVFPYYGNTNKDIISFNAIATGWRVPIKEALIKYNLPQTLNKDSVIVKVFTGRYGSKNTNASIKWLNNNSFIVKAKNLPAYNGVTVDLAFNRGAVTQSGLKNSSTSIFELIQKYFFIVLLAPFLFYINKIYTNFRGFIDKRAVAVMYEPPKDITTLLSGLILDTVADNEDYAAALLELAYLGYIKIEQNLDKQIILHATEKNRELLSAKLDLKMLLEKLLPNKNSHYFILQQDASEATFLRNIFSSINDKIYDLGVDKGYFKEKPYDSKQNFLLKIVIAISPLFLYFLYYTFSKLGSEGLLIMIFPVVFTTVGISIFNEGNWFSKIFAIPFIAGGLLPLFTILAEHNMLSDLIISPIGGFLIALFYSFIMYKKVGKYTQKGAFAKTHLLGLKQFIIRVKKEEIAYRLKSDPLYLERLLPYAVLFGETKHWVSLFSELNIATPLWYSGNIDNLGTFDSSLNSSSSYSESSGSSGFGGGGGSSGGGGGGGGGGSW